MAVSQTVCDDIDSFGECSSGILKTVSLLGFIWCFSFSWSMIRWELWVLLGRRPYRWSAIFITSYRRHKLSTRLLTADVAVDHLAGAGFVSFLHGEVTYSFSLLSTVSSWEGSHHVHLKEWGVMFPSLRIMYLHKLPGIFCMVGLTLIRHLLTQLLIYNGIYSWIFILYFEL